MMTVVRSVSLGLGALAVMVVAGCGGSSQPSASTAPASQAPSSSAPSTQPPSTQAPSTQAPSSQTSEPTEEGSSKPAKSDIVAGLAKFYETKQGLQASKAQKFATCMVDQMYNKAKVATLIAMRDGDPTKLDTADAGLLAESAIKCESALK